MDRRDRKSSRAARAPKPRSAGGVRDSRGALSLGYLSLRKQRKVARRRAASGAIAVQTIGEADS